MKGSFRGLSDLPLIARQVRFEQLSFWLNPIGAGHDDRLLGGLRRHLPVHVENSTVRFLQHINLGQYYVPAFMAYGVMAACFNVLAITW